MRVMMCGPPRHGHTRYDQIQHSLWGMEQTVQHQKVFMHSSKEKAQENSKELRKDGVYPMLKWEKSLLTADCVLILYAD